MENNDLNFTTRVDLEKLKNDQHMAVEQSV